MKTPNPMDEHVGSRMRMRRVMLGMSQERLAVAFGLTFQQAQKYEKGTNRWVPVGYSKLLRSPTYRCHSFSKGCPVDIGWKEAIRRQRM